MAGTDHTRGASSIGVLIVTIDRPGTAQRFIRSVRRQNPHLPIYVGDQSPRNPFQQAFYDEYCVTPVYLPYDSGVAASRNAVLTRMSEPYVLISDDDCLFTRETDLDVAQEVLDNHADVDIVGGRLIDISIDGGRMTRRNLFWELTILDGAAAGALVTMPVHLLRPDPVPVANTLAYPADTVLNFALMRRAALTSERLWDPQFKSNGEHEDFYVNWKAHGGGRILYLPALVAEHSRPAQRAYQGLRARTPGWARFMRKWGYDRHLELGFGLRLLEDVSRTESVRDLGFSPSSLATMHEERLRFFFGPRAPLERDVTTALGIGNFREEDISVSAASLDDVAVFAACRREHVPGEDLSIFIRPEAFGVPGGEQVGQRFAFSWRAGSSYLVYRQPIWVYGGGLNWSEWNAVLIAAPDYTGPLSLELIVADADRAGAQVAATCDVIFSHERTHGDRDDWVFGRSRPRRDGGGMDRVELQQPQRTEVFAAAKHWRAELNWFDAPAATPTLARLPSSAGGELVELPRPPGGEAVPILVLR